MKIALLDEEELEALIDFHESMAQDAEDSCEHKEAKWRRQRAANLKLEITNPRKGKGK